MPVESYRIGVTSHVEDPLLHRGAAGSFFALQCCNQAHNSTSKQESNSRFDFHPTKCQLGNICKRMTSHTSSFLRENISFDL
jgi:hypothetical protein